MARPVTKILKGEPVRIAVEIEYSLAKQLEAARETVGLTRSAALREATLLFIEKTAKGNKKAGKKS